MFKNFFKKNLQSKVLQVVDAADKANPYRDKCFRAITPKIHLVPKALDEVNTYGRLSEVYSSELVERYERKGFPFDIEAAIINLQCPQLIFYLTDAGHHWGVKAQEIMKAKHPEIYRYNVLGEL